MPMSWKNAYISMPRDWDLGADFMSWLESKNAFFNTLVDRIVPGYPRDEAADIEKELGYLDPLMVTGELFHFLVIEQREGKPDLCLPMAEKDAGTVIVPNADGYKERKVAILNGAHTGLCPLALLSGTNSVKEAMDNEAARGFLNTMLETEIIPYLSLPREELNEFSAEVLRRFANPFIVHRWYDISLNGLAKFHTRNLPRFESAMAATGKAPRCMSLSLAAWLAFYTEPLKAAPNCHRAMLKMSSPRWPKSVPSKTQTASKPWSRPISARKASGASPWLATSSSQPVSEAYEFLTSSSFKLDDLKNWA